MVTGLRIGALSRLQVPEALQGARPDLVAAQVGHQLWTLEKNGKLRQVHLSGALRVLVARWYRRGRVVAVDAGSCYLFPGHHDPLQPMSTRHCWDVCHGVFERAGLRGPYVHPHTFRHTVITMLFMQGLSYETIAKWIGHASPQTTANAYGHLSQGDLTGLMQGVPFVDPNPPDAQSRTQWAAVAHLLTAPYRFDETEERELDPVARPTGPRTPTDRTPRRTPQATEGPLASSPDLGIWLRDLVAREVARQVLTKGSTDDNPPPPT